jgi:hypothetical protein
MFSLVRARVLPVLAELPIANMYLTLGIFPDSSLRLFYRSEGTIKYSAYLPRNPGNFGIEYMCADLGSNLQAMRAPSVKSRA